MKPLRSFVLETEEPATSILKRFEDLGKEWRDSCQPPELKGRNDASFMIKVDQTGFRFYLLPGVAGTRWSGRSSLTARCCLEESEGVSRLSVRINYNVAPTGLLVAIAFAVMIVVVSLPWRNSIASRVTEMALLGSLGGLYSAFLIGYGRARTVSDAEALEKLIRRMVELQ